MAELDSQAKIKEAAGLEALAAADGLAEAKVIEAKAAASETQGMADVKVQDAKADVLEKTGVAEAEIVAKKAVAEAEGMTKKFEAMATMSDAQREHEEYRMRMDNQHKEAIQRIENEVEIAKHQASVLAEALKNANIDIVGGDASYLDSFVKSISVGKSIDGAINKSETLTSRYEGDSDFVDDAKQLLAGVAARAARLKMRACRPCQQAI